MWIIPLIISLLAGHWLFALVMWPVGRTLDLVLGWLPKKAVAQATNLLGYAIAFLLVSWGVRVFFSWFGIEADWYLACAWAVVPFSVDLRKRSEQKKFLMAEELEDVSGSVKAEMIALYRVGPWQLWGYALGLVATELFVITGDMFISFTTQ